MIAAIIFDMDGLLIDSEPFWRRAQEYAFGTVGVKLTEQDMRHTMGRRIDEVVSIGTMRGPGPAHRKKTSRPWLSTKL